MFYKSLTFRAALERPHVHSWVNLGRCHVLLKLIWEIPALYLHFCVRACACLGLCALLSYTVHRVRGVGAPGTGVVGVLCTTQIGSFLQVREAFNHCLCTESACGYQQLVGRCLAVFLSTVYCEALISYQTQNLRTLVQLASLLPASSVSASRALWLLVSCKLSQHWPGCCISFTCMASASSADHLLSPARWIFHFLSIYCLDFYTLL